MTTVMTTTIDDEW